MISMYIGYLIIGALIFWANATRPEGVEKIQQSADEMGVSYEAMRVVTFILMALLWLPVLVYGALAALYNEIFGGGRD